MSTRVEMMSTRAMILTDPHGPGKTYVMNFFVQMTMGIGGGVLWLAPTAQLTSRMKTYYGRCVEMVIDTCHAAYDLHLDEGWSAETCFGSRGEKIHNWTAQFLQKRNCVVGTREIHHRRY